jgi:hypothetical protein
MQAESPAYHHAVQFYGNDQSLFTTVSGFLAQGLVDGNPGLMIATPAHARSILEHLRRRLIDTDRAQHLGDLVVLDAKQTLALFMKGEVPDESAFEANVGRVIEQVIKGRPHQAMVRAYGEMVDVLWKQGRSDAAIRLEMLWNTLANRYGFALLCGYAVGNFYKQTRAFEEVCRLHTHVVPADRPFPLYPVGPRPQ